MASGCPILLLLLLFTVSNGMSLDSCPPMNDSILGSLIAQFHPVSDGEELLTFQLKNFNVTCLSLSNLRDQYRYITVSVTYVLVGYNNRTVNAMIDIGCKDNRWDPSVLGAEVSFKYSQPVPKEGLRKDCSMCISNTHPINSESSSDPITHCKGKKYVVI